MRIVGKFIKYYSTTLLHSATGFISPKDRLAGRRHEIHQARDKKLEDARERRRITHQKLTLNTNRTQKLSIPAVA
jgi:hypothetical protein